MSDLFYYCPKPNRGHLIISLNQMSFYFKTDPNHIAKSLIAASVIWINWSRSSDFNFMLKF